MDKVQTPSELAEIRMRKSAEYAKDAQELGSILEVKAKAWEALRANSTSDKQAEMKWNASDHGIKEMRLRLKLKSTEKELSAIRTYLEVLSAEARNLM